MIRIMLPAHLRTIARVPGEVELEIDAPVTPRKVVDAIELAYPTLRGTIRDSATKERRQLVRFFACEQDISHDSQDAPLPDEIVNGREPFLIIGAMSGG
ncbi:MAG TPA: MoaD/ThiS family protein [Thermomicrobiales bacterium]|nr:MoaD/ThiS family protein [Thermomicrobiales bacterium]